MVSGHKLETESLDPWGDEITLVQFWYFITFECLTLQIQHVKGRKVEVFANIYMKIEIALCCDVLQCLVSVRTVLIIPTQRTGCHERV